MISLMEFFEESVKAAVPLRRPSCEMKRGHARLASGSGAVSFDSRACKGGSKAFSRMKHFPSAKINAVNGSKNLGP